MKTIHILSLSVLTLFAINASGQEMTSQKGSDIDKLLVNCSLVQVLLPPVEIWAVLFF